MLEKNLNVLLTTPKKRDDIQYTQKYPEIPRNTRKYPRVKKIPENTRPYISLFHSYPTRTRYFFQYPTRYWKTLPVGHCLEGTTFMHRYTTKIYKFTNTQIQHIWWIYIGTGYKLNIPFWNILAIYRDWLHSLDRWIFKGFQHYRACHLPKWSIFGFGKVFNSFGQQLKQANFSWLKIARFGVNG